MADSERDEQNAALNGVPAAPSMLSRVGVTTNADLIQSIGRVEAQIFGLGQEMKELREDFRSEVKDLRTCLRDVVDGNGSRPGVMERIVVVEKRLDAIDHSEAARSMPRSVWLPLSIGTIVSLASLLTSIVALRH